MRPIKEKSCKISGTNRSTSLVLQRI